MSLRLRQVRPSLLPARRFMCSSTSPHPQPPPLLITRHDLEGKPVAESSNKGVIVILALNRPEARNALNKALVTALNNAVSSLAQDQIARVLLLTSSAPTKAFCAGADLKERANMSPSEVSSFVSSLRALMDGVENLPMPALAVLEGGAYGGGLELALACDMRVAGPKAEMGLTETSLAIIPGAGGTQRLPRLIGASRAKEMMFRATRIGASEAHRLGLVNAVATEEEEGGVKGLAARWCREIASNGPVAVRAAKQAVREGMEGSLAPGLEIERACYAKVIPTEDRLEGLRAFREKRKPMYAGK